MSEPVLRDRGLDPRSWPPYGQLNRYYQGRIDTGLVPPGWTAPYSDSIDGLVGDPAAGPAARPTGERETAWLSWRTKVLAEINSDLWPCWNPQKQAWQDPNVAHMRKLTTADFELFARLRSEGFFDSKPVPPNAAENIPTHRAFFIAEDGAKPVGTDYAQYDTLLSSERAAAVAAQVAEALQLLVGSASLQLKSFLQRPRAYQMSLLLGVGEFAYEMAVTSMTPSMSSGHSLEGCIVGAAVYDAWLTDGFSPSPDNIASLQQFAVDVGDRRVLAGVHYPSDNLASWWIALRLCPGLFARREVHRFLAEAITQYSLVFAYLRSVVLICEVR